MDFWERMTRDLMGGMEDGKNMEEMFGPGDLKQPQIIFAEAEISGLKHRVHQLQGCINSYHKCVVKYDEKIKVAGETESKLRKKLYEEISHCHVLEDRVCKHERNLQAQSTATNKRSKQLAILQKKFTNIKACLNDKSLKNIPACDMRKIIEDIMVIVTDSPETATEQVKT